MRELGNVLERAVVLGAYGDITLDDLALPAADRPLPEGGASSYQTRIELAEKEALLQALKEHRGDKRAAARAMGVALSTFYAKLKKYQL